MQNARLLRELAAAGLGPAQEQEGEQAEEEQAEPEPEQQQEPEPVLDQPQPQQQQQQQQQPAPPSWMGSKQEAAAALLVHVPPPPLHGDAGTAGAAGAAGAGAAEPPERGRDCVSSPQRRYIRIPAVDSFSKSLLFIAAVNHGRRPPQLDLSLVAALGDSLPYDEDALNGTVSR